jgi:uncharacterized protein
VWGHSSVGRALGWHSRGRRFDPVWLHQISISGDNIAFCACKFADDTASAKTTSPRQHRQYKLILCKHKLATRDDLVQDRVMSEPTSPILIYVDADACPVKPEVYRVAERHRLRVFIVANSFMVVPPDPMIERVIVSASFDAADDWIAERAARGAIVITADVPLASRCVKAGADVIAHDGRVFSEASIGMALATRDLMQTLRESGQVTGGPAPFSARARSAFLSALDLAIVRLKRAGFG